MTLSISTEQGRVAARHSIVGFVAAADSFSELELLGTSRCHGWTRLDVVVHVIAGWHEWLGGFVSPVSGPATVDAATYWPAFSEQYADDPIADLMAQRRRTAAYARPSAALSQLRDVAAAVSRATESIADGHHLWDGHVFTAGDYLAIWAVENVIHHLDLHADVPAPGSALALARATVVDLADSTDLDGHDDVEIVLAGAGRASTHDAPVPVVLG